MKPLFAAVAHFTPLSSLQNDREVGYICSIVSASLCSDNTCKVLSFSSIFYLLRVSITLCENTLKFEAQGLLIDGVYGSTL